MNSLKYLLLFTSLTLLSTFSTGFGQSFPPSDTSPDNAVPNTTGREFVQEAARGAIFEVLAANLALTRSNSPVVRRFAVRMIREHQREFRQLNALANSLGVPAGTNFNGNQSATLQRLSRLIGPAFTREYLRAVIMNHLALINRYRQEINTTRNATVRALAARQLPELNRHLQQAFVALSQSGVGF